MFLSGNTTIIVNDFKNIVQFYVDTLELKLGQLIEGHLAQVEAPGLTLWLIHPDQNISAEQEKPDSISIGFEVKDLTAKVKKLKARGVEFYNFLDSETTSFAYFKDPEGNPLYLVQLKSNPHLPEA